MRYYKFENLNINLSISNLIIVKINFVKSISKARLAYADLKALLDDLCMSSCIFRWRWELGSFLPCSQQEQKIKEAKV